MAETERVDLFRLGTTTPPHIEKLLCTSMALLKAPFLMCGSSTHNGIFCEKIMNELNVILFTSIPYSHLKSL